MSNSMNRHGGGNQFCGRTRREFLWQTGGGFTGTALAGLLGSNFFADQTVAADGAVSYTHLTLPTSDLV